mmetsp:Transcript_42159/g.127907  ORF Transcript_42159/g.127907 Transcript_42159/m.127907 type:complete len:276 (+) Transcript_42159:380-1207(+)
MPPSLPEPSVFKRCLSEVIPLSVCADEECCDNALLRPASSFVESLAVASEVGNSWSEKKPFPTWSVIIPLSTTWGRSVCVATWTIANFDADPADDSYTADSFISLPDPDSWLETLPSSFASCRSLEPRKGSNILLAKIRSVTEHSPNCHKGIVIPSTSIFKLTSSKRSFFSDSWRSVISRRFVFCKSIKFSSRYVTCCSLFAIFSLYVLLMRWSSFIFQIMACRSWVFLSSACLRDMASCASRFLLKVPLLLVKMSTLAFSSFRAICSSMQRSVI